MYDTILVTLDATEVDRVIIEHVKRLGKLCGSRVVLLHVADGWAARRFGRDAVSDEVREDTAYLAVKRELELEGISAEAELAYGEPKKEILKWVESKGCSLIAMSTHGHRFLADLILGTTAAHVQHRVDVPVLLISGPLTGHIRCCLACGRFCWEAIMAKMKDKEAAEKQQGEVDDRKSPSGKIVYASILAEAREELKRPSMAILWSGLAAGLSMGFSVLGVALLDAYLPAGQWTHLVSRLGYSLGFLVVILGRQQLFTENTLTPVLQLLRRRDLATLGNVMRLWGVVLVSNIIGALIVSFVLVRTPALEQVVRVSVLNFSASSMGETFGTMIIRGAFAGWLIALIVWLLPFAEAARIWVIIILTYVVALGSFPHVIAGSVEVFSLAWVGTATWGSVVGNYVVPTLVGNIVGGVMLVAVLGHAQAIAGDEEPPAKEEKDTGLP